MGFGRYAFLRYCFLSENLTFDVIFPITFFWISKYLVHSPYNVIDLCTFLGWAEEYSSIGINFEVFGMFSDPVRVCDEIQVV